ncbi:MAG: FAD-dependent oxidoreductase [Bacteroidales bacterium]|nr:FAD-dependent oxidoreductase [Bacteroidales bacterium]
MAGSVIVIGAGSAGMEVSGVLARSGVSVTLIEKTANTGGHVKNWHHLFPDHRDGADVVSYMGVRAGHKLVNILTGTEIRELSRKGGKFHATTEGGSELTGDAVVVATGFDLFDCSRKEEYGYGIYDNVHTSAELEEMFRAGRLTTASGKEPEKIGFVHCVGSRDEKVGNLYCSKLCCVTAVKQAIEVRKKLPRSKVFCFYMDMRMGGASYEELYREAQEEWGISFIRGKVSEAGEMIDHRIQVKVEDTLVGRPLKLELDMLFLMAGMEMSEAGARISRIAGLKTGENRFLLASDNHYGSNRGNVEGIFYAGSCTAPMNITETISHARAAATEVIDYLNGINLK